MTDPAKLVRDLDPQTILNRLAELDSERSALRVLLRAARRARPIKVAATTTPNPTGRNNGGNT